MKDTNPCLTLTTEFKLNTCFGAYAEQESYKNGARVISVEHMYV